MRLILAHLIQILVAGLGGFVFYWLGVPAAWLSGSAIAATLWGLTGLAVPLPKALADAAMLTSGAAMGAAVTPAAIEAMGRYPGSLLLLVLGIVAISATSSAWLVRMSGWRKADAVLASVPGALSTVLAVAADRKAEVAAIAIVQNFRLFVLIALLPSLVVMTGGGGNTGALVGAGLPVESPGGMAFILLGGLALGTVFKRLKVAAPILLGATVVSSVSHGTEFVTGVIPPAIATGGLVLIGLFIADRFRNLQRSTLRRALVSALGSFTVGMVVAALFASVAAWLAGVSFANGLVAFAPGGLEAMTVLALILGLDPLYVGIHHLVRFLGIGLVLPFLIGWLQRARPEAAE
ncbi:AbrB family transcriptional regulator [Microvirga lotononidis]|uniref:Putative ammonia monooxygenase n=1 Tax=Microvirga lotononidis TaxID=864069 RepID=I4YXL8_9HYPH|nr:AbrB family transcriptional regulator [Microvirga lotononidis]EIM28710.1 putative ammonia monooxygenase [Microvirga lotononidis]WQO25553.1 AbrB family transcriptional regulator [Microvirga lotononidis]